MHQQVQPREPIYNVESFVIRKIRSPLYKDTEGQCTLDEAVSKVQFVVVDDE